MRRRRAIFLLPFLLLYFFFFFLPTFDGTIPREVIADSKVKRVPR